MASDAITYGPDVDAGAQERAAARPDRAALHAIRILFDRGFYLAQNPDVAQSGLDPLDHFLTAGLSEGRSPCVLFDPAFYLGQPGAPRGRDHLFLHYLEHGIDAGIDPHPLLDSGFYARQSPPLPAGTNPLTHMLGAGRRENRRPSPLFDAAYYRRRHHQADRTLHPLIHYALHGWRERLQPHPLFDPQTYLETRPDIAAAGIDPLAHFLRHGRHEASSPHWLFDADHYRSLCPEPLDASEALLHFAIAGCGPGRSPHPLFDAAYYLQHHPDLARSGTDPFLHFLEFGVEGSQDPHPLFDSWFYRTQNPDMVECRIPPLRHYVCHGAREGRDPNPYFPAPVYLVRHPEAACEPGGPLVHFLRSPHLHLERLSETFDPAYYLACNPSCARAVQDGMPPLGHYLSTGRAQQLLPVVRPFGEQGWSEPPGEPGDATGDATTPILLIVPDGGENDAARHALQALLQMRTDRALRCRAVLLRGGPLAAAFAAAVPTVILSERAGAGDATSPVTDMLHAFHDHSSEGIVIVTSVSMPSAVAAAAALRLRLLAWVHEMPVAIDGMLGGAATMRSLASAALRIVTGSDAARDTLVRHYGLSPRQVTAIEDGIASPRPHPDQREAALLLRARLGLPPDVPIVLGQGPVGFRSGTDLFIQVAQQVVSRAGLPGAGGPGQARFLWIGPADDPLSAALCRHDIERLGLSGRVWLIEPDEALVPLLGGADLCLLPARDMASGIDLAAARESGLRVIVFGGGSTGPRRHGPIEVGYLDVEAMSEAVIARLGRPARRGRHRPAPPTPPAGPSWGGWLAGMRRLLEECCGIPPAAPVDATAA